MLGLKVFNTTCSNAKGIMGVVALGMRQLGRWRACQYLLICAFCTVPMPLGTVLLLDPISYSISSHNHIWLYGLGIKLCNFLSNASRVRKYSTILWLLVLKRDLK